MSSARDLHPVSRAMPDLSLLFLVLRWHSILGSERAVTIVGYR
jgi:hypothetical protein